MARLCSDPQAIWKIHEKTSIKHLLHVLITAQSQLKHNPRQTSVIHPSLSRTHTKTPPAVKHTLSLHVTEAGVPESNIPCRDPSYVWRGVMERGILHIWANREMLPAVKNSPNTQMASRSWCWSRLSVTMVTRRDARGWLGGSVRLINVWWSYLIILRKWLASG